MLAIWPQLEFHVTFKTRPLRNYFWSNLLIRLFFHMHQVCLLEEGKATHSSILAWKMPWTEEPGRLQFIASHRVKHYWYDLACIHTWGQNVYTGLGWLKVLRSVGWVKFICIKIPEASWERVYSSGSESLVQTQCLKNWKGKAILKQPHVYPSNYFPVPVSSCLSTQKMELEIKWMR